ncbi:hypothetical protein [Bacillus cereus]|uniref:Uncharacterized protein n=1 Tax=Bacillus cereus TaxID=1396 RepID=A0AA44QBI0_BACCE|nr:hypothetical protein [Bacillus cereus]PFN09322.1 hypothetical protein COJ55_03425 [Bacillus cereus]PFS02033.1 hypothetical protein COK38_10165 [Bacillus cereus]
MISEHKINSIKRNIDKIEVNFASGLIIRPSMIQDEYGYEYIVLEVEFIEVETVILTMLGYNLEGKSIMRLNGIAWDNAVSNLQAVLGDYEQQKYKRYISETDKQRIRDSIPIGAGLAKIAEFCKVSIGTVIRINDEMGRKGKIDSEYHLAGALTPLFFCGIIGSMIVEFKEF